MKEELRKSFGFLFCFKICLNSKNIKIYIQHYHFATKLHNFFCSCIIVPGTYILFQTLSFIREGAKLASFLEVKLFTRLHISKWIRNSMYLARKMKL